MYGQRSFIVLSLILLALSQLSRADTPGAGDQIPSGVKAVRPKVGGDPYGGVKADTLPDYVKPVNADNNTAVTETVPVEIPTLPEVPLTTTTSSAPTYMVISAAAIMGALAIQML